ncbi:hypothetical protein [Chelatococcus reniformis]|uniref:Uncharacterized protein n=1 Tax=Chelatococcus reniformis TaxID=1494448 RepID=A0A916U4S4_9HYPH|nr:hypothetical protein [Chelatococcus reniformis]GGC60012.1 hypothetical protein GCM10010994_18370 [Chelatococcus reniformis]
MVQRLIMAVLALCAVLPARAHEAPSGWTYGYECCSGTDCYQISSDDIEVVPGGWRIKASGETIPASDRRVKPSGDGRFHRCSLGGIPTAGTICLYIPAGS